MSTSFVIGRVRQINTGDDGNTLVLGDSNDGRVGAISLQFVDAKDSTLSAGTPFSGTITVVGRSRQNRLSDLDRNLVAESPPYVSIPFRAPYLNGSAGTYDFVTTAITTTSLIHIPVSGLFVALLVTCASGSGYVYWTPVVGAPAV